MITKVPKNVHEVVLIYYKIMIKYIYSGWFEKMNLFPSILQVTGSGHVLT